MNPASLFRRGTMLALSAAAWLLTPLPGATGHTWGPLPCAHADEDVEGPVRDAQAMVAEGEAALAKADKDKRKRPELLTEGLKKYARAYLLITGRKLQNDAPDLLQQISDKIAEINKLPEVTQMRRELLGKAIDASVEGKLTEAYDYLARLRDLDPREWTVEYALSVIGQRMEGG